MTIYWDHNATSPLRASVRKAMQKALECCDANPNSSHSLGQESRAAIETARRTFATALGLDPSEIIFTASATEANAMALWGLWMARTREAAHRSKILSSE